MINPNHNRNKEILKGIKSHQGLHLMDGTNFSASLAHLSITTKKRIAKLKNVYEYIY